MRTEVIAEVVTEAGGAGSFNLRALPRFSREVLDEVVRRAAALVLNQVVREDVQVFAALMKMPFIPS